MPWPFIPHRLYNRRADIHGPYGGQQQGGIATPTRAPAIFIFTGHGAKSVGYGDEFLPDGSMRYTGEGQVGDMAFVRGNFAILNHARDGKDLLVFETIGRGKPVRFVGLFVCSGWAYEQQTDTTGSLRQAIVFDLVPVEAVEQAERNDVVDEPAGQPLSILRQQAHAAATPSTVAGSSIQTLYKRSRAVRTYVLARAAGVCEACGTPAPFTTAAGAPYLEPHHIRRLSDGGPDHPRHVAGICPNCHRRAHYGADAKAFNDDLANRIARIEPLIVL